MAYSFIDIFSFAELPILMLMPLRQR